MPFKYLNKWSTAFQHSSVTLTFYWLNFATAWIISGSVWQASHWADLMIYLFTVISRGSWTYSGVVGFELNFSVIGVDEELQSSVFCYSSIFSTYIFCVIVTSPSDIKISISKYCEVGPRSVILKLWERRVSSFTIIWRPRSIIWRLSK